MKQFSFTVLFLGLFITEIIGFSAGAIATPSRELSQQFLSASFKISTHVEAVGNTSPPPPGGST